MLRINSKPQTDLSTTFYCDHCRKPITDVQSAVVLFPREPGATELQIAMLHLHKGECERRAASRYGQAGGSREFRDYVDSLARCVGLRRDGDVSDAAA